MTKGKFDTKEPIVNHEAVALFGYLARCNNQIHDFQNSVIKEYLIRKEIPYSIVHDVIFFKEEAVSFEEALSCLRKESQKVKAELIFYLMVVSEIDGITDFEERDFFDTIKAKVFIEDYQNIVFHAQKKANTERKRFKKINSVGHTGKKANPNSTDNLFRITQKEYLSAITRCRKIAKEDYEKVKPISENIISKGKNISSDLHSKLKKNINFHPEVIKSLEDFTNSIEIEVFDKAKIFHREFAKKETTVEDFTIALIGRTKAGKSTLRTVLTGQGKENIGCGSQRTTRINDIYEWNHLRIIDTPGIDAASDENNEDQKIAEKVIGESDIICYIAASDGLPKNAREFAVNLAKRNKPVIVLVNYKSNINGSRLRRFIENPSQWHESDSNNAIEGYFNPIKRLAEENGVEELISYNAVFLYAELLSKEENYQEYAKILSENSGVNEFLVQLKDAVVNKGAFLRSKTIIDDTIVECNNWVECIEELVSPINKIYVKLSNERETTLNKFIKAQNHLLSDTKYAINNSFKKLATSDASAFADDHYMDKGDISKSWEKYCENIGFNEKLKKDIDTAFRSFSDEIASVMNDLLEDLQFVVPEAYSDMHIKKGIKNFPFREFLRFTGAGLGIAGAITLLFASGPAGWILAGAGLVISFVSGLFKSKAQRQRERKNNLYNKINSAVNDRAEKFLDESLKKMKDESEKCISEALSRYDELLHALKFTSKTCEELINELNSEIDQLNIHFAERIIEFISNNECTISNVEREYGKSIKIYPTRTIDEASCDFSKIKGLLNEKIEIQNFRR